MNLHHYTDITVPLAWEDLFYDPQTSGGLLIAIPAEQAGEMVAKLIQKGEKAAVIGSVTMRGENAIIIR